MAMHQMCAFGAQMQQIMDMQHIQYANFLWRIAQRECALLSVNSPYCIAE
jgi:hypothetical protein